MRIAFDYQIFTLQSYGGISRYFVRLAQGLLNMEQHVGVFAPLHLNTYLSALPQEKIANCHINRFPPKAGRIINAYNHLRSRAQIARWQPDLVHETYYAKTGSAPRNCPTLITVYDMIHELFQKEYSRKNTLSSLKQIAISRADHVICISNNTKIDLMRLYGVPEKKISVVLLGFDQFTRQENIISLNPIIAKPFLLYVGPRNGYKNFSGFLKSVASSPRLLSDFDIVAFGGPSFTPAELSLIYSQGFNENQVQHKSGNDEILGRLYSSARAFVYPSLYEGFGIPLLEAMAHHCPVISSNTSSMPEVAGNAAEYFNPLDTNDLRQAIEHVVYSDSRISQLQKIGGERLKSFSWAKCSRETLEIYRSLI